MLKTLRSVAGVAFVLALMAAWMPPARAAFPDRPITLIVPWAAGGGTDSVARMIASLLETEVKVPVNVINRVGGLSALGSSARFSKCKSRRPLPT